MTGDDAGAMPDGATLGWELSTAVVMFHEAVGRRLGLSAVEHKALGLITRTGPVSAGDLARYTGLTPGAVTGLVDRLERVGYVRRVPDPADRRRLHISAVAGQAGDGAGNGLGGIFAELGVEVGSFMAKYDERELRAIVDYVTNMTEVLRRLTHRLTEDTADPH